MLNELNLWYLFSPSDEDCWILSGRSGSSGASFTSSALYIANYFSYSVFKNSAVHC